MKNVQMNTVERRQRRCSDVYIVKYEHVSLIFLIADFNQPNFCRVYIENTNTFKGEIRCIIRYVVVFSM